VQIYAPTTAAIEDEHEEFYEKLRETLDNIPKGDILIVMGDFNAKVGQHSMPPMVGKHGLGTMNEAGEKLADFCAAQELIIANTWFAQPKRRLYTWTAPGGKHRNQIDYILISKRWRSTIKAVNTLPGADCGSDHELLVAKLQIKLKKVKRSICQKDMTYRKYRSHIISRSKTNSMPSTSSTENQTNCGKK
jgi:endonuclease/exonuclease/phosphatase family metal-dependent hydrolase